MAVSSVSSSSSSSSIYGSRNVISGLASGMDTESMIENMVSGIKTKIDTQKQNQQILLWQQEAYRSISDQLVQISNKYTSYTSSTNLMSSAFFQPSIITSLGENASKISASGSTNSDIKINSVSQMAQTETISFTGLNDVTGINPTTVSGKTSVDLTGKEKVSNLAGQQLSFKYGNKSFSITFDSDREYEDLDDVVDEINKQLGNASISLSDGTSIKMSDKIEAQVVDSLGTDNQPTGDKTIAFTFVDGASETNTLEIKSSSSKSVLDALHFQAGDKLVGGSVMGSRAPITTDDLQSEKDVKDILAGASMNVTYNGTTVTIKMPEKDSEEYKKIFGDGVTDAGVQMQNYLQTQLDQAFGYNRIKVEGGSGNSFTPTFSVTNKNDTLSIDSGTLHVVGKGGIFGLERGASNRVNTSKTLGDLYETKEITQEITQNGEKKQETIVGLDGLQPVYTEDDKGKSVIATKDGKALYALEINGVRIGEYTADTTLETIMSDINSKTEAGVKVNYSTTSDQFVFTSTHGGSGGQIAIASTTEDGEDNLAAKLFGTVTYTEATKDDPAKVTISRSDTEKIDFTIDENGNVTSSGDTSVNFIKGRDAEMNVSINGQNFDLTSGTNTFNIDGFTVTANGTFTSGESVSFDKKVDADKIVDAVKSFVEDYNKVLAEINEQYTTQPDHKKEYKPLTDDQKADMTEKQIEEYETKAKQGLLFGDSDLGGLSSALRFVFSNSDLDKIGVSVSTSYSDKGKITLDETKLRSALASDPDSVAKAFAEPQSADDTSSGGAMSRLKVQLDKYAATTGATKGILIEKAGSQYSPIALLQNTLQDKIDSYDDVIDKLTDQLNDKIDFYTSKFSKLEALIAQMNSQSSYLSSLGGSSY